MFAVRSAGTAARQMSRAALVPAPRPRAFGVGFDALSALCPERRGALTHFDAPAPYRRGAAAVAANRPKGATAHGR